jgi:hypothetical protein
MVNMSDILFLRNEHFCQLQDKQKIELYRAGIFSNRRMEKFGYTKQYLQKECLRLKLNYNTLDTKQDLSLKIADQLVKNYQSAYKMPNEFEKYIKTIQGAKYWKLWISGVIQFEQCNMMSNIDKFKVLKTLENTNEYNKKLKEEKTRIQDRYDLNEMQKSKLVKDNMLRDICRLQRNIYFKKQDEQFYLKQKNTI